MARIAKDGRTLAEQIRQGVVAEVPSAIVRMIRAVDPIARRKAARDLAVLMAWRAGA